MKTIYKQIEEKIQNALKDTLPDLSPSDLEENGRIYYMNGKNGTEFDWFVNEHLPSFMVFYSDKDNLGAAKATVYDDGGMIVYIYDDHGQNMKNEIKTFIDVSKEDMLTFAVCLRTNTDDKKIWDLSLENIESFPVPDEATVSEFLKNKKFYEPSIRRKEIFGKTCIVSKKITGDGWKPGLMLREEPTDERDSGWEFLTGDETDEYVNSPDNFDLCLINSMAGIDPVIMKYIDNPEGACFVRMSSDEFEEYHGQKPYPEKWK